MSPRAPRTALALLAVSMATACNRTNDESEAAAAVFSRFQSALLAADRSACRKLLSDASCEALAQLPWHEFGDRKPLDVLGARPADGNRHTFIVDVRDPNENDASGCYVVVREQGRLVVDLIGSAGLASTEVAASEASATSQQFAPRELTPADHDRIRAYELAQPPSSKARGN